MADILLTQSEGDALFTMSKIAASTDPIDLPDFGGALDILLHSENKREEFVLNFTRHSINIAKRNHHFRGRKIIGLARLDLEGPPHRNPDGEEIGPQHLHLYKEGFGLKWASDVPDGIFMDLDDAYQTLRDFMTFCNVITLPNLRKGLFS